MEYKLLIELTLILSAALLGGLVASKIKQPLVIGYIVAGLLLGSFYSKLIGPATESISTMSEIGVALLLFTLGLEFSLDRIKKVGKAVVLGAILQILIVIFVFFFIFAFIFNLPFSVSIFLSSIISLSSTAVVAKLLSEEGSLESSHGDLILSWLIVQDLAVIPLILLIPAVSDLQNFNIINLLLSVLKSAAAIYLVLIVGKRTIPFLFKKLALYNNRELMLVAAFLFCLLTAYAASIIGISFAIGAFLAGILLSTSAVNHEVFTEIRPLRDLFSSVFFVTLGFLVSVDGFWQSIIPAIFLTILIFTIKFLIVFILLVKFNYHSKISYYAALALFQIGEFGFLLAKLGFDKQILDKASYELIILSSILTLISTPIVYSFAHKSYKHIKKFTSLKIPYLHYIIFEVADSDAKLPQPRKLNLKNHIILVGYGRVGKYISKILDFSKIPYVVIDLHFKTLRELRKKGLHSVYGDATNEEVLKIAGIEHARGIILAIPEINNNETIISYIRTLNPSIQLIVRAHKDEDIAKLAIRGIKHIIEPEFEAGIEMGKRMLKTFNIEAKVIKSFIDLARKERKY